MNANSEFTLNQEAEFQADVPDPVARRSHYMVAERDLDLLEEGGSEASAARNIFLTAAGALVSTASTWLASPKFTNTWGEEALLLLTGLSLGGFVIGGYFWWQKSRSTASLAERIREESEIRLNVKTEVQPIETGESD